MVKRLFVKQLPFVAVLVLACFLMFWRLGETYLTNWDEAWYADVSRTMAETGNFLTPMWNGQPFLEKPPLFYWLTALSYKVFGDSEFSARFISALSGVGTVGLLYWFARKYWGLDVAIISSFILLSTPAFLWRARTGNLDSLLTFLIFLSAVAHANKWIKIMGISAGLAFLTKGFIGFLYPLISGFRGLILGGAIALTWFTISYFVNGQLFLEQFFTQQGEKIGAMRFSLDYLSHLKTGLKVWFLIAIPSLYLARKELKNSVTFVVVFLLFLSFLQEKSTWFLHPIYPFIALICGWSLVQLGKRWILPIVFAIALFQLIQYRGEYFVADIAADESRVAIASRELTHPEGIIYLTHYYFPTAVYYSRRTIYAVYSEHASASWWILPKSDWQKILAQDRIFINTSVDDLKELEHEFPNMHFEVLYQSGDKLFVKKAI